MERRKLLENPLGQIDQPPAHDAVDRRRRPLLDHFHRRRVTAGRKLPKSATAPTYIFGAICPQEGKGAALVLPACSTFALLKLLLAALAKNVAPDAHAALLVDRVCQHMTDKLVIPPNVTLAPLPAKCPERDPAENVWRFPRDNWLSNRDFKSYDDIVNHCCDAWNKLVDQPWKIMSIGLRDWAHRF